MYELLGIMLALEYYTSDKFGFSTFFNYWLEVRVIGKKEYEFTFMDGSKVKAIVESMKEYTQIEENLQSIAQDAAETLKTEDEIEKELDSQAQIQNESTSEPKDD